MTWHPSLAEQIPLVAVRLGFKLGELRLYLRAGATDKDHYVIQFDGVAGFYDKLPRGQEVRISDRQGVGSFGYWLDSSEEYRSVMVSTEGPDRGFLLVLALQVGYRLAGASEAIHWPG